MEKGKERHMFPGNNTGSGFFSYFDHILPQQEANHIFCLKGGPGTGKSTFMKHLGSRMQNLGWHTDYFHCSSDPDSLDGVLFPIQRIALVDGTAPHAIDPIHPGVVDEIINLGECWDAVGIKKNRDTVVRLNARIKALFTIAHRDLAAAKCMSLSIDHFLESVSDREGLQAETDRIIQELLPPKRERCMPGKIKKMFASAVTPLGIVQYIDTLPDDTFKTYLIKSKRGTGVSGLLEKLAKEANSSGADTEQYYCPLSPENKIEHLVIPGLKLAFVSENEYYAANIAYAGEFDLAKHIHTETLGSDKKALDFCVECFDVLLKEAVETLSEAKAMHDEMEKYFVPYMDFKKVGDKEEEIMRKILRFASLG